MLNIGPRTDVKIIRENMSRHGAQTLGKTPDMDIMNTQHTIYLSNILYHRLHVHITRRAFEQDIDRILQDSPGIVKDEKTDQHTDKWVEPIGIREINDHTCNDRTNRGNHIPHQMDKSRTEIEVVFTATMDKQGSHKIDNYRNEAYTDENT